jgi:hypothetical protein
MFPNSMIPLTIALAITLVLIGAAVARARLRRRGRLDDRFNLGAVSQEWLLVHQGDERR